MDKNLLARIAGTLGMAGALLWIVSTVMEHTLGLLPPGSGPLFAANQTMFTVSMIGTLIGILGLLWAGAVNGRFGKIAVGLFALSYALLIMSAPVGLIIGDSAQILLPIGGLLSIVAAVLTGIAVAVEKRWPGWQRFMPLIHAAYVFFILFLPLLIGADPTVIADGPGMVREAFWGVSWFFMGLAVYTSQSPTEAAPLAMGPVTL